MQEFTYTETVVWGDPLAGDSNVYTYAFNTGLIYTKTEKKNIVTGTFANTVTVEYPVRPGVKQKSTLRALATTLSNAKRVPQ